MKKHLVLSGLGITLSFAAGGTVYVSTNGLHTGGFTSPANAATNIQAAVDAATNGQTVVVLDGIYLLSTEVMVTNAIYIAAANPPPAVVVDGQGITRCFYLADTSCTLEGLVITNGLADVTEGQYEGGGVYCESISPVITNCIIMDCVAESGGGVAFGTINNSVIKGNSAEYGGGCLQSVVWWSDLIDNTASEYGGGLEGSNYGDAGSLHYCRIIGNKVVGVEGEGGGVDNNVAVSNCLLVANEAGFSGGAISYNCHVVNCTIVSNYCGGGPSAGGGGVATSDIFNSIVAYNASGTIYPNLDNPQNISSNSCSPNVVHDVGGNTTNLPSFVDFGGGVYQLDVGSPCIDAGNNAYASNLVVDLAGAMRINGGTVDMGAFEFYPPPYDLDADRMRDEWEVEYFGSTNAVPGGAGDSDPFSNLEEFIAGTDPTNGASYFQVTNWSADDGAILEWASVSSRLYTVWWSTNLLSGFQSLEPAVAYPGNSFTDTVHSANAAGYYKVKVELQ